MYMVTYSMIINYLIAQMNKYIKKGKKTQQKDYCPGYVLKAPYMFISF